MQAMSKEEYRKAIKEVGLNTVSAASFFEVSMRTGGYWAQGRIRIPGIVAKLLREMVRSGRRPVDIDPEFHHVDQRLHPTRIAARRMMSQERAKEDAIAEKARLAEVRRQERRLERAALRALQPKLAPPEGLAARPPRPPSVRVLPQN